MELIFATHNKNKLIEVQALMPSHISLLSLTDIGLHDEIPETAVTIAQNAVLKVKYVRERFDLPVFADDTGLLVHALNNAPGVHTARYAGEQRDNDANMNLLLTNLNGISDRSARFITVIALSSQDGECLFEGVCSGVITSERMGDKGFGYDPIFKPDGYDKTFAQMTLTEKGTVSHRAKALGKLIEYLSLGQ